MKVGYALGGGAARGLAHIGVLKVLEENGLKPDFVAGTSMGAVIGALYAGGYQPREIEHLALGLDWKKMLGRLDLAPLTVGLLKGKRVVSLIESILGNLTFSQLKYPFACVATDIITGEQVVMRDGSLLEAIRASISLPGIFTPVASQGRFLVAGGLINTVPVSVCRDMGADYVIGVNVIPAPGRMMCRPGKETDYPVCENGQTINIRPEPEGDRLHLLRTHINNIQNASQAMFPTPVKSRKAAIGKAAPAAAKVPHLWEVLVQTITIAEYHIALENMRGADLAIHPHVEDIGFWQFIHAAQAIAAGERAARLALASHQMPAVS